MSFNKTPLWIMLILTVIIIVVIFTLMSSTSPFNWDVPSSEMWLINYTSPVESQSIYGGGTEFPLPNEDVQDVYPTRMNNALSPPKAVRGGGRVLFHRSQGLYGPDLSKLQLPSPFGRCARRKKCTR